MTQARLGPHLLQGRRRGDGDAAAGQERRAGRPAEKRRAAERPDARRRGRTRRRRRRRPRRRSVTKSRSVVSEDSDMAKRWLAPIVGSSAVLRCRRYLRAQQCSRGTTRGSRRAATSRGTATAAPAPKRDLTGIWDAGGAGIGARGCQTAPLTPWGEALGKTHKAGDGIRMVPDRADQRSAVDDGRSGRLPAQPAVRAAAVPGRADAELGPDALHVREAMARDLDRRPPAAEGSRSALVRLLGRPTGKTTPRSSSTRTAPTSARGSTTPAARTATR